MNEFAILLESRELLDFIQCVRLVCLCVYVYFVYFFFVLFTLSNGLCLLLDIFCVFFVRLYYHSFVSSLLLFCVCSDIYFILFIYFFPLLHSVSWAQAQAQLIIVIKAKPYHLTHETRHDNHICMFGWRNDAQNSVSLI